MFSSRLQKLHPYVPGEQPNDKVYLKLNANENPYPPCKEVKKRIEMFLSENFEKISRYPDPDANELKVAIAKMLNKTGGVLSSPEKLPFEITPDMIYCGNGSDEVLSFVFYAFFDSDKILPLPEFTYSFYPVYAEFYDIPTKIIPLNEDWSINADVVLKTAKQNDSAIIIANPNALTGLVFSRNEIENMLKNANPEKAFVVDEAYCDFACESSIGLLKKYKNLVVVRTFSKSLCGAGLRLGYAVANPEMISALKTVKDSLNHFPIDAISKEAGIATCENVNYYADCAKKIVNERDSFLTFLKDNDWFALPSKTNFVFTRKDGFLGEEIYSRIKKHAILVRHFSTKGIENFVRISIGTKEQMSELKKVMRDEFV